MLQPPQVRTERETEQDNAMQIDVDRPDKFDFNLAARYLLSRPARRYWAEILISVLVWLATTPPLRLRQANYFRSFESSVALAVNTMRTPAKLPF